MKKTLTLLLIAMLVLTAVNFAVAEEEVTMVMVPNAEGTLVEVAFPKNIERVVVLNHQTMDFLDAVGLSDKVVGYIKEGTTPSHLKKFVEDESIANVGGMKDIDMEKVMELEPDVIFSSDRTESKYDEFSMIAPTFAASVDYSVGFFQGFKNLAATHAQIFGLTTEVEATLEGYATRIAAIKEFATGKTALLGIFAGGLNTLGDIGRAAIITTDMGFTNLQLENVNHGNLSSYEAWLELNPDYMFVLDKDTAVGREDAIAAQEQMDNDIIKETNAYKNGNIIYLTPGTTWYVADGGITSMDQMINCIEVGLGLVK